MDLHRGMSWRALVLNVLGALLVLAGIGLEAMTARAQIGYSVAVSRHGGEVIDLGADALPAAGQHGYMARIVGTPEVVEAPQDPEFNLRANTPVLLRRVEMFQWREISIGGIVHYEQDWVDHPVDSSHFEQPHGHENPGRFPIVGKQFDAGLVQVDGFKLGTVLIHALPGSQKVVPRISALPENLMASFSRYRNYLVTSSHPGDPRLGDLRVSWDEIPLQQLTIVGRLDGDRLEAASDASDGKGYQVQIGDVPLLDLFPDLPIPPDFVMTWRILSVLLASLGVFVLLSVRRRYDILLSLGLGSLGVGAVACVLWVGNDGDMVGGWLALCLFGLGLAVWRLRPRSPTDGY